ncbi:hypothetical protein XPA_006069 [Xanthoria parietina]
MNRAGGSSGQLHPVNFIRSTSSGQLHPVNFIRHHYTVSNIYGQIRLSILLIYQLAIQSRPAIEIVVSRLPQRRQLDPAQYHFFLGSPTVPCFYHLSTQSRTAFNPSISIATKKAAAPPVHIVLLNSWLHPILSGLEQPFQHRFDPLPKIR